MNLFSGTSSLPIHACEQFISDNGLKPAQADSGDIN
jgi:hypothetical protein